MLWLSGENSGPAPEGEGYGGYRRGTLTGVSPVAAKTRHALALCLLGARFVRGSCATTIIWRGATGNEVPSRRGGRRAGEGPQVVGANVLKITALCDVGRRGMPQMVSAFGGLGRKNNLPNACASWQDAGAMYRYEALSVEGFIQQLAVCYVGRGYFFYVTGVVPERKDPCTVDATILGRYHIDISKWSKWRGFHLGREAKLQYLRFERFFVILATHGGHHFLTREKKSIRDARKVPIKFAGYSVSFRGGHACVRIEKETEKFLKTSFVEQALKRKETLEASFYTLPFEPYKPVRQQLLTILREVNRLRSRQGLEPLSRECIRFRRHIVRPFDRGEGMKEAA
jgi:hypothetical protein